MDGLLVEIVDFEKEATPPAARRSGLLGSEGREKYFDGWETVGGRVRVDQICYMRKERSIPHGRGDATAFMAHGGCCSDKEAEFLF
jgi:hypothetical protein